MIEKSPWVFDYYELNEIIEGENLNIEYLENEVNDSYLNSEFIFYKEGIGSFENKSGNISSFAWEISNNTLIAFSGSDLSDTEYLKNINVTQSQFTFEAEWGSYDDTSGNITLHSGTYYFK